MGTNGSIWGTSLDDKDAAIRMIGRTWEQGVSLSHKNTEKCEGTKRGETHSKLFWCAQAIITPPLSESEHREEKGKPWGFEFWEVKSSSGSDRPKRIKK